MLKRILVTGAGGVAGVNFIRALRASKGGYYIVGTDYSRYYLQFPDLDKRFQSPKHSDPGFIPLVKKIVEEEGVDFIHPQPTVEAQVIAERRGEIGASTYLPRAEVIGMDKYETQQLLSRSSIPVAKTVVVSGEDEVEKAFDQIGEGTVWVRARVGAGGRLSLHCRSAEEASTWMKLWVMKGAATWEDFMVQEYLPGRNIAWDSLWFEGRLVTSYSRERLEYPFKHISPSGITGTPTVARIVHDEKVNRIGADAVLAVDERPHGSYSIDIKENGEGVPCVTEVDAGKFHTTAALWGFAAVEVLGMPWYANISDLYTEVGLTGEVHGEGIPRYNLYPEGLYLLRHIDCGAWLWREDGWKARVL